MIIIPMHWGGGGGGGQRIIHDTALQCKSAKHYGIDKDKRGKEDLIVWIIML